MHNSRIIGWERILPELSTFFSVLEIRTKNSNDFIPFNLFLSGRPGTNKTEGILTLCRLLRHSVEYIDCSTLDDIAELAGVIDIQANREKGIARLIEGELLNKTILVLDEFLNARPHVVPQFRLLLQGKLKLLAKEVPIKTKCLIATANLSEDMDAGDANVLDSPTADRFAMLVRVPAFSELSVGEKDTIIEERPGNGFEKMLLQTVHDAAEYLDNAEKMKMVSACATRYVRTVAEHLYNTPVSFEGRRAQLLHQFVNAAYAISGGNEQKFQENVSRVLHATLGVVKLTGQEVKIDQVSNAHRETRPLLMRAFFNEAERAVFDAPTLEEKVRKMIKHRTALGLAAKLDVCEEVKRSNERTSQLAFLEFLNDGFFNGESVQLKEVAEGVSQAIAVGRAYSMPSGYESHLNKWKERLPRASVLGITQMDDSDFVQFEALMGETERVLTLWRTELKG